MTPYYADDLVTLYHGDCLDVLPQISDVDAVITSPPYNLGVTITFRLTVTQLERDALTRLLRPCPDQQMRGAP